MTLEEQEYLERQRIELKAVLTGMAKTARLGALLGGSGKRVVGGLAKMPGAPASSAVDDLMLPAALTATGGVAGMGKKKTAGLASSSLKGSKSWMARNWDRLRSFEAGGGTKRLVPPGTPGPKSKLDAPNWMEARDGKLDVSPGTPGPKSKLDAPNWVEARDGKLDVSPEASRPKSPRHISSLIASGELKWPSAAPELPKTKSPRHISSLTASGGGQKKTAGVWDGVRDGVKNFARRLGAGKAIHAPGGALNKASGTLTGQATKTAGVWDSVKDFGKGVRDAVSSRDVWAKPLDSAAVGSAGLVNPAFPNPNAGMKGAADSVRLFDGAHKKGGALGMMLPAILGGGATVAVGKAIAKKQQKAATKRMMKHVAIGGGAVAGAGGLTVALTAGGRRKDKEEH